MVLQNLDTSLSKYNRLLSAFEKKPNEPDNIKLIRTNIRRLEQINNKLKIKKYRLIFIGEPGSGKTTTICNYLGFTKNLHAGDTFNGFELFDVGSGRTTAFEVHYRLGDWTKFSLTPMKTKDQKLLIKDYCEYVWSNAFDLREESSASEDGGRESSSEYDRVIRNMAGFTSEDKFIEFIKGKYSPTDKERFIKDISRRINIDGRTATEISLPSFESSEKTAEWLKKSFSDINNGRNPKTAIPERVDIILSKLQFSFYFPEFISEVIDTRGFDGGAREDLRGYLRADDTITVLLDKVASLPSDKQRVILQYWTDKSETDIINRTCIMVKDKGDALAQVNEADGDPERGEQIKRSELLRKVRELKLHYNEKNTVFVDSYAGIETRRKKVPDKKTGVKEVTDIDNEFREDERMRITDYFKGVLSRYEDELKAEAKKLISDIEELYQAVIGANENIQLARELKRVSEKAKALQKKLDDQLKDEFVKNVFKIDYDNNLRYETTECEDGFCKAYEQIHVSSIRKSVLECNGTWFKADIFAEYTEYCEKKFRDIANSIRDKLIADVEETGSNITQTKETTAVINSCIRDINSEYVNLVDKVRDGARTRADYYFNDAFWKKMKTVRQGSGVRRRWRECIREEMHSVKMTEKTYESMGYPVRRFFIRVNGSLNNKRNSDN